MESFVARTGRAELDEHIIGVNMTEFIIKFNPHSGRSREEVLDEIREAMADIPGISTSVEQPLAHLISAMLSGVQSQVAIKLYGDDLDVLRGKILEMKAAIADVPGIRDLMEEPQIPIPQLRIEVDRKKLARRGLTPGDINRFVETAMHGKVVSEVLIDQRTSELFVRFDEPYRRNVEDLHRLSLELLGRETMPLSEVARIYTSVGPNTINHEHGRRRVVLQCNVADRGLVDVVRDIQKRIEPIKLPTGYSVEYGGQFQSQQSASQMIALLFIVSLAGMFLVLFTMFRSINFSLQIMCALPLAFIGAVAALKLTNQTLTIASMVGFISLCGIATRNGILLLDHYIHLVKHEGETWSVQMIIRAGQERLAPVLMTALTAGIGLVPLAMAAGEPGKEILYPRGHGHYRRSAEQHAVGVSRAAGAVLDLRPQGRRAARTRTPLRGGVDGNRKRETRCGPRWSPSCGGSRAAAGVYSILGRKSDDAFSVALRQRRGGRSFSRPRIGLRGQVGQQVGKQEQVARRPFRRRRPRHSKDKTK